MRKLPQRILSIDVFRAITMLLMIFVNDVAGVQDLPDWIGHADADFDGMGFSDVIFPMFLFIVGLSLPFAIETKRRKKTTLSAVIYILVRSFALIAMGFFHVNFENYNHDLALLSYPVFVIVTTLGFFMVWMDYPQRMPQLTKYLLMTIGLALVIAMGLVFKGGNAENVEGLKPHWWGILGIIGWAYLFTAATYLLTNGKLFPLIISFLIFSAINVTTHLGVLTMDLWMIGDASSITLMLGGVVISGTYALLVGKGKTRILWVVFAMAGVFSIAFGFFIRPYAGGISKIYATPAWVFICMGVAVLVFELLIYVVDFCQRGNWFKWIKAAGTSTLTCYLLPYLIYSIFALVNFNYPEYFNRGFGGMVRAAGFSFVVIQIVAFMEKRNLRLKI